MEVTISTNDNSSKSLRCTISPGCKEDASVSRLRCPYQFSHPHPCIHWTVLEIFLVGWRSWLESRWTPSRTRPNGTRRTSWWPTRGNLELWGLHGWSRALLLSRICLVLQSTLTTQSQIQSSIIGKKIIIEIDHYSKRGAQLLKHFLYYIMSNRTVSTSLLIIPQSLCITNFKHDLCVILLYYCQNVFIHIHDRHEKCACERSGKTSFTPRTILTKTLKT